MRILGHGIDLADITQMDRLLRCFGNAAIERQFTEREISGAPPPGWLRATYFASRFAAKEAVLKALGVGFATGVAFTDVEVSCIRDGAPRVELSREAAAAAERMGIGWWILSLSHAGGIAVASVIAVDTDPAATPNS